MASPEGNDVGDAPAPEPRALVVEDAADSRSALVEWLERHGFPAACGVGSVQEARELIRASAFDLVLLDLELPDGHGLELLEELEQQQPGADVVIVTGHGSIDSAMEAVRGGVVDYLTKPVDMRRLQKIVEQRLRTVSLCHEVDALRQELRRMGRFGRIVGTSAAMQKVYDLITRVAPTSSTVLVTGETGTGKELVAETIHRLSRRAAGPFLPVNCGAVAPNLIEAELFGYEKGSFTGAERQHKGFFERAHGGSLLLDEITEMPPELQVRLLRVLETSIITRVGGDQEITVDARLIAATNRNAAKAVADGKLREDLLYRLNVFPIEVPPLREREGDVDLLAAQFLDELNKAGGTTKRWTPGALRCLRAHGWPGNVRELKNIVERAYIIAADEIGSEAVPLDGLPATPATETGTPVMIEPGTSIKEAERRLILATLAHMAGDKKRAAAALGISLKTLYSRLSVYGEKG